MSLSDQLWSPTSAQVTVHQARGLRIKGKGGTNDAYAVMQVGKEKYQTSVVEKSVAPVWKEEATFDLPQLQQAGGGGAERSTLHVHVLHRALVGPDKLLGQAVINLLELSQDKTRNKTQWFKLLDKTGKADKDRGEVLVDIQFLRNNMTASMFDLSAAGKSRSRLGKFKDKVRSKKKDSDVVSNVVPSFPQVLTDSEEDGAGNGDGEVAAGKDGKKKKKKLKSLFAPKSNLQRNMSQSMTVLPAKNVSLSGSQSSGLNVESSEGKKKFKFMIHKRSGSSDSKDSSSGQLKHEAQSNVCINGSHVYCDEPPARNSRIGSNFSLASSGHGSMEDVPESESVDSVRRARQYSPWTEEEEELAESVKEEGKMVIEEEEDRVRMEEEGRSQEEERMRLEEEEKARKAEEERIQLDNVRRQEEEWVRLEEEKRREEEEKARKEEEERIQIDKERRQEEERKRLEEEKRREEEERIQRDKERRRQEEERMRLAEEERIQRDKERRQEEERRRLEEEKRREEEERARKEEEERIQRDKERRREEERMREEEEKARKEEEERIQRAEERRQEEEERIRMKEERQREERKLAEERRRVEEEEKRKAEEHRVKMEEEERKRREVETLRRQEEEQEKMRQMKEEGRQMEEEEKNKKEEEEKARRENEEYETVLEEKRMIEEKSTIEEEVVTIGKEEEERAGKEKEEHERELQEKNRQKHEERRKEEEERDEEEVVKPKMENITAEEEMRKQNVAGTKPVEVTSLNPFDENFPNNSAAGAHSSTAGLSVPDRSHPAALLLRSKTSSSHEKDLIGTQREKRLAPQPPGKSQAQGQRGREGSTQHPEQVSQRADSRMVNVLLQRSVQAIAPVSRPPTAAKNMVTQSSAAKGTIKEVQHRKGPAPSRPYSGASTGPDCKDPHKSSSERKQQRETYGLNPFEDDEEDEFTVPDDLSTTCQGKTKSSKKTRAPTLPEKTGAASSTSVCQNTLNGSHNSGSTVPDNSGDHPCDPKCFPDAQTLTALNSDGKKEGPPTALRRLQPVKPLEPLGNPPVSADQGVNNNKPTGVLGDIQEKEKVNNAEPKGPYSQLTRAELVSLVLKQESQLTEKDQKISELEEYIDRLLVCVMEEKPSILMSMSSMKKTV